MLERSWPLPWEVSVPSFRRMIWGCCGERDVRVVSYERHGLMGGTGDGPSSLRDSWLGIENGNRGVGDDLI